MANLPHPVFLNMLLGIIFFLLSFCTLYSEHAMFEQFFIEAVPSDHPNKPS